MSLKDAPKLGDWITVAEAKDLLEMSKQGVHKLIAAGTFHTIHRIGKRPIYVMSESEVKNVAAERHAKEH